MQGTIIRVAGGAGFAFIRGDDQKKYHVHFKDIAHRPRLKRGMRVEFQVDRQATPGRAASAKEVRVLA